MHFPAEDEAGADLSCWDHSWHLGQPHTHSPTAQDTILSPAGHDPAQGDTSPLFAVPPSTDVPQHPLSTLAPPAQPRGAGEERVPPRCGAYPPVPRYRPVF